MNIDKETKRISLSYKAIQDNPWEKLKSKINEATKIKISHITDKAIFGEIVDSGLSGALHWKEISYSPDVDDLKKFKKNEMITKIDLALIILIRLKFSNKIKIVTKLVFKETYNDDQIKNIITVLK